MIGLKRVAVFFFNVLIWRLNRTMIGLKLVFFGCLFVPTASLNRTMIGLKRKRIIHYVVRIARLNRTMIGLKLAPDAKITFSAVMFESNYDRIETAKPTLD